MDIEHEAKSFYWKFIKLEIPNFIQILGLITILSYQAKNLLFIALVSGPVVLIFQMYMSEKFYDTLLNKIVTIHTTYGKVEAEKFMKKANKMHQKVFHIAGFLITLLIVITIVLTNH